MSEPTIPQTAHPTPPADLEIDASYGPCDPPLQELMRWMRLLPVGAVLAVESSDPSDTGAIPQWLRMANYDFLGSYPWNGHTRFVARKTH
jgi:TusA-related sulfurtransferase